jgi:hypothetical protein
MLQTAFSIFPSSSSLNYVVYVQIYVSPFEVHEDVAHYYLKLLEVGGVQHATSRIKLLYPENFHRFPEHFSLSKLALYSPKLLHRIRTLIGGRPAYLVPHSTALEDLQLAVALDVPLYAAEPEVTAVFGSKSGCRRIFQLAEVCCECLGRQKRRKSHVWRCDGSQVELAVGAHDIVDDDDLYSNLSRLIVDHLHVARWIFKIDNEFGGRGIAYFDVQHIKVHHSPLFASHHICPSLTHFR